MEPKQKIAPKPYEQLDIHKVSMVAHACLGAMRKVNGAEVTYKEIAKRINDYGKLVQNPAIAVTDESLKAFSNREAKARVHINNLTVKALYLYLTGTFHKLDQDVKRIMLRRENWTILNGQDVENQHDDPRFLANALSIAVATFYSWCRFGPNEISRAHSRFSRDYVLLRKSVNDPKVVVKSKLRIFIDPRDKSFVEAIHTHHDRHGVLRESRGFVTSVVRNLYIVMQVEDSEGLEIIALRDPVQKEYVKMMGFMQSINADRKILSARVFIEREDDVWASLKPRFRLCALDPWPERKEMLKQLLDPGTALTIPDVLLVPGELGPDTLRADDE
jgi:hypothetical protein